MTPAGTLGLCSVLSFSYHRDKQLALLFTHFLQGLQIIAIITEPKLSKLVHLGDHLVPRSHLLTLTNLIEKPRL